MHIYINRTNNRLVFKIKYGCKLELKTPETIKLFGGRKKINRQNKKGKILRSLEMFEIISVQ